MPSGRQVAVVDYGMGNLDSVRRSFEVAGASVVVADDPLVLSRADKIVLPGVGAFGVAMQQLRARGLDDALSQLVMGERVPVLGICLGMQLMAATGTEHGTHSGLGWIPGCVQRLQPIGADVRVPHVGWNDVEVATQHPLFSGMSETRDFYFVHSFHFVPADHRAVVATTPYAGEFVSAVGVDNIWGVQFHPEKSQDAGQAVIRNFLAC